MWLFAQGFAQFGGGFGGGFSGTGGFGGMGGGQAANFHAPENWIPDTVPLRIKKFKADQLGFYLTENFDTTVSHLEQLPPAEHYNDVWLGNLSYAFYPNNFEQRMKYQYPDFYYLNGFMDKIYLPSNNFYFRTNRPYTDLYYASSPKLSEQQIINAIHTQNINYYTNFGLVFNTYTSMEPVSGDNSAVSTLLFWIATEKPKYRYNFVAFINSIKLLENGGIIDTTAYFNPESPQYFLTNGTRTKIGFRGLSFNPEVLVKQFSDSQKVTLQANMLYARHNHSYVDPSPVYHPNYYQHYYIDSAKVFDSVSYDLTQLELNAKYISKKYRATIALGDKFQSFYYFINYIFRPHGIGFQNIYVKSGVEGYPYKNIYLTLWGKYYLYGRRTNDVKVFFSTNYRKKHINAGFVSNFNLQTPSFFLMTYSGNVAQWYNLLFKKQLWWQNKLYFALPKQKFYVDFQYWLVSNYIHFVDAEPQQENLTANVLMFNLKSNLRLGFIHFDNQITLQYSPQNQIFNLPLAMVYSSLWFKFYMFKHALGVNTGLDTYWNSGFKLYSYSPSVMAFYFSPGSPLTGNFPVSNIFINFKVKRADIFVKFDYIDFLLNKNLYYETAEHYHYPQMFFRYGVRWWFKN